MNIFRFGAVVSVVALATALPASVGGAEPQNAKQSAESETGVRQYRSPHFIIHSDIPPDEAEVLLKKLETMLGLISKYWGRPLSGAIKGYVVRDLKVWPQNVVQGWDPMGLAKIEEKAGVCITQTMSVGNRFVAKVTLYAYADHDVVQHESVHAYCGQTFGRTGPDWYAEGMAELGNYWKSEQKGVNANPYAIRYLRTASPVSVAGIISMRSMNTTWQNYAWCWSLCHLLENNPNYSATFRALGLALLMDKPGSFETAFGPVARQLQFEHSFLIQHLEPGFRADLCAWQWKRKFLPLATSSRSISCYIQAGHGWQPSGLTVTAGSDYSYSARGTWKLSKEGDGVDADGTADGTGRLMGIVMKDYQLSKPFPLGSNGSFRPDSDGDLYLRANDKWTELDDNSGRIVVKFESGSGK